jgi:hypothetical protein
MRLGILAIPDPRIVHKDQLGYTWHNLHLEPDSVNRS